jgi:hypothetical protein
MTGFMLTPGQMKTVRETVRLVKGMTGGGSENPTYQGVQQPRAVVLDAALDVATHALTGATSALATRCIWSPTDEEYTETEQQITVWNHSENQSYEADTFGKAEWIDGHWWFVGDCGPMGAR